MIALFQGKPRLIQPTIPDLGILFDDKYRLAGIDIQRTQDLLNILLGIIFSEFEPQ